MSKFEMLCSLLPAEINWGDPITPQMVEEIVATEREACAITGGAAADAGLDGREVANAIRMRSNVGGKGLDD